MPRQDVPYGGAICRLKERIAEIWDKLGEKLRSINGVEGDAAGNVEIVSGDAAVVITSDQVNHRIEVALDSSQLPAAAVSSVNGQTGAVALDADDIIYTSDDITDSVKVMIDGLLFDDTNLSARINNEAQARQNTDNALQTNINAALATIPGEVSSQIANNVTIQQLVAADADNVKLTGNQSISGIKNVPLENTGTYSGQIASSQKVKNELDNYAPMVRTTGNQTIEGQKTIETLIVGSDFNNKNTVTLFDADTSKYCRLYTYNGSTGPQYKTFVVMITPKRININKTGILYFGDNRNVSPVIGWMIKGSAITDSDFVITKESDGTIDLWCKTYTGASDGYHGIRILEHTTSGLSAGYLQPVVNEPGYTISSSGYTDNDGVVHTFTHYITPS